MELKTIVMKQQYINMKKIIRYFTGHAAIFFACTFSVLPIHTQAQNVGIGTNTPLKKLSVNGSIAIDHDLRNNGSLDSAALIFGNNASTGISSSKIGGLNLNGLDLWTNGTRRFSINQNGYAGIGTLPNTTHRLSINGRLNATGNISTDDSLFVNGHVGIGTAPDGFAKLKVNGLARFNAGEFQYDMTVGGIFHSVGFMWGSNGATIAGVLEGYTVRVNNHLRVSEYASIGGSPDSTFRLRVYDGNSRFGGSVEATGNMTIGGALDDTYRLRVVGGNSRFGGDAQVTGRMAIGGDMDNSYRLRVYDGDSRFGGNVEVTGQLNTASVSTDALSIGGKGAVRSDGLSPLRIGFTSKYVDVVMPAGTTEEYTVNITDFTGDNDDIRVMVSQFSPATGGSALAFERTVISVTNVNASDGTCKLKLHNSAAGQLYVKGTIYLMCVAKN